jgi:hypothetical protein
MASDPYEAASARAQAARRAGIQAKKDEQPENTARSYRSKQEEWKARHARALTRALSLSLSLSLGQAG